MSNNYKEEEIRERYISISRVNAEFLRELKAKSDIVEIVSNYVRLQKRGRDYWACCPFHHEKTPSFQVRADHQTFHCFGCNKGGNVITFIMEQERLTYPQAVEWLAKRANIQIPDTFVSPDYSKYREISEKIYNINREAARFFYTYLFSSLGGQALKYLTDRGLNKSIIKTFGLGYSPADNLLIKHLEQKGYDVKTMVDAGLARIDRAGRPYQVFSERIMFPIIDSQDRVIGFGGRVFNKSEDFAKYVNTFANPVFNKSNSLYAINLLKKLKQTEAVTSVILVEGYMDVISLYKADIKNVVASMGTSLTKKQCDILSRFTNLVYICFDGDSAGQTMTLRGLDLLKQSGLEVKVVELPENCDPDDTVKQKGKNGFWELLDKALPLIDFKLKTVEKRYNLSTPDGRQKYAKGAIAVLNTLDAVEREIYAKIVAQKSGIDEELIKAQSIPNLSSASAVQKPQANQALALAARFVLASMMEVADYVGADDVKEEYFENDAHKQIFGYVMVSAENKRLPKFSDLYDFIEDKEEIDLISQSLDSVSPEDCQSHYTQCLLTLFNNYKAKKTKELTKELARTKDKDKQKFIMQKINELNKTQPIK
ncbi:MAG: DNA primase [Christensenellales bacterium]